MNLPENPALLTAIEKADRRLNDKAGWNENSIAGWYDTLIKYGSVEVGWRESCGSTDRTVFARREWIKIAKKIESAGIKLVVERVKHKNAYATNHGGFWNSEIFRLPLAA